MYSFSCQHKNNFVNSSNVLKIQKIQIAKYLYLKYSFELTVFGPLMPWLSSSKGYGEDGLYSEREGLASAPVFGSGLVGKRTNNWAKLLKHKLHYFHIIFSEKPKLAANLV